MSDVEASATTRSPKLWPPIQEAWNLRREAGLVVIDKPAGAGGFNPKAWVTAEVERVTGSAGLSAITSCDRVRSGVMAFREADAHAFLKRERYVVGVTCESSPLSSKTSRVDDGTGGHGRPRQFVSAELKALKTKGRRQLVELVGTRVSPHLLSFIFGCDLRPARSHPPFEHRAEIEVEVEGEPIRLSARTPARFSRFVRDDKPKLDLKTLQLLAERRRHLAADPSSAFRLVHGPMEGFPWLRVDVFGKHLVLHLYDARPEQEKRALDLFGSLVSPDGFDGIYVKRRAKKASDLSAEAKAAATPKRALVGSDASDPLMVEEDGARYRVRLGDGFSTGLFLDQRDARAMMKRRAQGKRVLNLFSYTCSFSLVAALGGAREVVSVDGSKRVLDWGHENFVENELADFPHERVAADVFQALDRFAQFGERFDLIVVDPPTYSTAKKSRWRSAKGWRALMEKVALVASPNAEIFACSNDARMNDVQFERHLEVGLEGAKRKGLISPMSAPIDFPGGLGDYLKRAWVLLGD